MNSKLAIIDWGIGGLGIYKRVKERLGDVPVVYISDTGATPYGKMSRSELVSRLNKVLAFLQDRDVTHVVIGCNAASTAIPFLNTDGIKVEGVIESAVAATLRQKPKRLGLIGGRRTVLSGVYREAFAMHGLAVEQRIAQPLSGLIESGDTGSEQLRDECRRILSPLKNCSHILLACTHYPSIIPSMKEFISPGTNLIDPANKIVDSISRWRLTGGGADIFLTTGDIGRMSQAARAAWDVRLISKNVHI